MSAQPTPETDALWHSLNTGKNQPSWWVVAEKMRDLARRLEARARFFENGFHTHSDGAHEYMIERDEARKERDDALAVLREIANASGFDNIGNWARNKAKKALTRYETLSQVDLRGFKKMQEEVTK